ncbi:MAG: GerMN domain-containing protein [Nitrospinae bacterium]|nr:GerMN domain-containing protein [Nitrospinota bacterium]
MKRYIFILIVLMVGIGGYFYFTVRHAEKSAPEQILSKDSIILYFSSNNEEYLVPEVRQIILRGHIEGQILEVIKELIKGSTVQQTNNGKGLINVIPDGVRVNGARLEEDGTLFVDFSKELKERHPGGSWAEMLTIYSIVDTIIKNFPDIKRVKILIEDEEIETLAGHIDTRLPLTENKDIVRIDDERKG